MTALGATVIDEPQQRVAALLADAVCVVGGRDGRRDGGLKIVVRRDHVR